VYFSEYGGQTGTSGRPLAITTINNRTNHQSMNMTRMARNEAGLLPDTPAAMDKTAAADTRIAQGVPVSNAAVPVVQTEGLTKRVATAEHELTIVNNIHFTVQAGEAVAIVGASGSGKSTLLGLLAGLDTPHRGAFSSRVRT